MWLLALELITAAAPELASDAVLNGHPGLPCCARFGYFNNVDVGLVDVRTLRIASPVPASNQCALRAYICIYLYMSPADDQLQLLHTHATTNVCMKRGLGRGLKHSLHGLRPWAAPLDHGPNPCRATMYS